LRECPADKRFSRGEEEADVCELNERLVGIYENVIAGRPPGEGDDPEDSGTEEARTGT